MTQRLLASRKAKEKVKRFELEDGILVAHGTALSKAKKFPAFESVFPAPCKVTNADHMRYELGSLTNRVMLKMIHSRRLLDIRNYPPGLRNEINNRVAMVQFTNDGGQSKLFILFGRSNYLKLNYRYGAVKLR